MPINGVKGGRLPVNLIDFVMVSEAAELIDPVERRIYELAKDRNFGNEPSELHLAYEREMWRLRIERDRVLAARRASMELIRKVKAGEVIAEEDLLDLVMALGAKPA